MADDNPPSSPTDAGKNCLSTVVEPIKGIFSKFSKSKDPDQRGQSTAKPTNKSSIKEDLMVTARFLRTLAMKAPEIADENPAKLAFGLVKLVIEIANAVKDNKDEVARQIASTGAHLNEVEKALGGWTREKTDALPALNHFRMTLLNELRGLETLKSEPNWRKFLDHEDEQARIKDIFVRVNEARVQFELALNLRVFKDVYEIDRVARASFLEHLRPSVIADHKYLLEGKEGQQLHRQACTPGTRVRILDEIVTWARDDSSTSPNVYWLFGHAGSGKTTIAYTIARRFEFAGDSNDSVILGGNFMCSRQFENTRLSKYIVRTIVYHLAQMCKAFADALIEHGRLDTISQDLRTQLTNLLFTPWQRSMDARRADHSKPQRYLIVIDALDEIDGTGGPEFLRTLFDAITKTDEECLEGLKFFITSRSDPNLAQYIKSLDETQLSRYHLQDVQEDEAHADVVTYLDASLPAFVGKPAMARLADHAAGLFIYAATVVKLLEGRVATEQASILKDVVTTDLSSKSAWDSSQARLDQLYLIILREAFRNLTKSELQKRLRFLHTFLCAAEPLSALTATRIIYRKDNDEEGFRLIDIPNIIVNQLHSVLYVDRSGRILFYHKSFPDFIFNRERSGEFSCHKATTNGIFTTNCFKVMEGLRFNIANIPSSFVLDKDNDTLADEVQRNISDELSYSCRNWDYHLSTAESPNVNLLFVVLSEFVKIRALFWLEAMNLLDLRGRCYPMLRSAYNWVSKLKADSDPVLSESLAEAASFALYFSGSGASSSTPHLYISALATWHGKADVCEVWKSHFPGLLDFVNARTGGALMAINVGSRVYAVAFSPDGGSIVSGSDDKLVRIWDASTGKVIHNLAGHIDRVTSVAFSSDGSRIVSGSWDKSIRLWDALTGAEIRVLKGHTDSVNSVAFSTDGSQIVSGSDDYSARIWVASSSTGEQIRVLNGHTHGVNSVAFSTDDSHIVSGSEDHSVRVWDASSGAQIQVLRGHSDEVCSVAFSSNGSRIVSSSDDRSIRIWDASTGAEIHTLRGHTSRVRSIACSKDDNFIVSGSDDQSIRIWNASTGREIRVLEGHTNWVNSVAFSSDGSRIASGSEDNSIQIWDASPAGDTGVLEGNISAVYSVALSNDGSRIVSGSVDGSICIWDASTGTRIHTLEGHTDSVNSIALSIEGDRICSGSSDRLIHIWDASTGAQILVLEGHTDHVYSVAFSSDGSRIISGSLDGSIRIWNALTGKVIRVMQGPPAGVYSFAFSTEGDRVASGSSDHPIWIWDVSTGAQILVLEGHTDYVYSVAFSSDGSRIASGSNDNSIRIWDASRGKVIHVLKGHTRLVSSIAFSSDGSCIVSGSWDHSIRIWDASTGTQIHVLEGHTGFVSSVTFSSDGTRIVSGSYDKSIRIWDASTPYRGARYIREKVDNSLYGDRAVYTGWLRSEEGYLMFVPPEKNLPDAANILTIPYSHVPHVNFTNAALGPEWAQCYFEKST